MVGDLAGDAERAQAAVEEALETGAEVVVLPEPCTSGYAFESQEEDGWVRAESREPGLITAEVDLQAALEKRYTDLAAAFGDRRPYFYGSVAGAPAGAPR